MKKIKVVHIITKLELGGAQKNTLYTVEHLNKDMFEVYLLTGRGGMLDNYAKELAHKTKIKLFFVTDLVREIHPWKDCLALIELFFLLKKILPDIVHTHSSKAGILGRWASKFVGWLTHHRIKIIHTFHGFGFSRFHKWFVRYLYIFLEIVTAKISHKLIFVSKANINTALEYKIVPAKNTTKILLIRSGIKFADYKNVSELRSKMLQELNITKEVKVISTIGPFKPQKNLVDFITMAKIIIYDLKFSKYKLHFFIAGDGEQRKLLTSLVERYKLHKYITFLSWYKNIPGLMSITDIFVMTSLWEGLPRSAVESLLSGVPVIAYETDGLKDIIKENINGYLLPAKNVFALAKKVVEVLSDEKKLEMLKSNAKNSVDTTFDIDYMVEQQQRLYIEIVSS